MLLRQGWRCVPLPCHLGDKRDLSDGFRWAQAPTPLPIPLQTTDHYRSECTVKMQLSHQYPSCHPLPVAPGSAPLKRLVIEEEGNTVPLVLRAASPFLCIPQSREQQALQDVQQMCHRIRPSLQVAEQLCGRAELQVWSHLREALFRLRSARTSRPCPFQAQGHSPCHPQPLPRRRWGMHPSS